MPPPSAKKTKPELVNDWDPLSAPEDENPDLLMHAQRREIRNILKSYTGYYDLFSELLQNALDAVERRSAEPGNKGYEPTIWIMIDMKESIVSVTDNGCGMNLAQFRRFLKPNYSFKDGASSRGSKGVGATYLGYGFNHLEIATKQNGAAYSGILKNGRIWVDDINNTVKRPFVNITPLPKGPFSKIDRGTRMAIKLAGPNIRPKELAYVGAKSAHQWLQVLKLTTPIGGIYLAGPKAPQIKINVEVRHPDGDEVTKTECESPQYLYPHTVIGKTVDLRKFISDQNKRIAKGEDVSKTPAKYLKLNGLWGEWSGKDILEEGENSPIRPKLDKSEQQLATELGISIYVFLAFSTELWDDLNDNKLHLRKGHRLVRGGLQLATRSMPQGLPITIPMTNNIGFQNLAHVIVHMDSAEPDLGRKGFQPEHVRLAEKLAVSAVTAFRKRSNLLRKATGEPIFHEEIKLDQWIEQQKEHEKENPLVIKGKGLFMPTLELPIRSTPLTEQDVVATFNQMLSSGLVRGVQLISSSQYQQYDGLFRVAMDPPFEKYILAPENPLGVLEEVFTGQSGALRSAVKILEYKYSIDALIEDFQNEIKSPTEVGLVVAWEMGEKWRMMFDVTSYLDDQHTQMRRFHGCTHSFVHSTSGARAFEAIVLKDMVSFLRDPKTEIKRQRKVFSEDAEE